MVNKASLFAVLAAATTVFGAECFGQGNQGFSKAEFEQTAARVCSQGPNAQLQFGTTGFPNYYRRVIERDYKGNAKIHCKAAFENIIAQCVVGEGRNGGHWDWDYNGVVEHYYIQSIVG